MSEETEKAYWEGYIQKQNEAVEICKQCKYRKKARELETKYQKLIEKLEEYKYTEVNDIENIINFYTEIKEILKGEKT